MRKQQSFFLICLQKRQAMEIKDRIKKIIDYEKLSSSKFADAIGIQRSSVSHILSGRNNPSLEVVQKILTAFGTLNSEWLLFGRGAMHKTQGSKSLFNESENIDDSKTNETIKQKEIFEKEGIAEKAQIFSQKKSDSIKTFEKEKIEKNHEKEKSQTDVKTDKIIVFNSDRTFIEYKPA